MADNFGEYEKAQEHQHMLAMAEVGSAILNETKHRSHVKFIEEHCEKILKEAQLQTQYQERIAIALERIANHG